MLRRMLAGIVVALVLGGATLATRDACGDIPVTVTGTPDDFSFKPPFQSALGIRELTRESGGAVRFRYENDITHSLSPGAGQAVAVPCAGPDPSIFAIQSFHHLAPEVPDPIEAQPAFKGGGRVFGYWGVEFAVVERGRGSIPYYAQALVDFSLLAIFTNNGQHHTLVPKPSKPGAQNLPRIDALFPFRDQVRLSPTGKVKDAVGSVLWDPPGLVDVFGSITIGGHAGPPPSFITVDPNDILTQSQGFSTYSFTFCPPVGVYIPIFRVDWEVRTTVIIGQTIDDSRGFEQYSLLGITPLPGLGLSNRHSRTAPAGSPICPNSRGFGRGT